MATKTKKTTSSGSTTPASTGASLATTEAIIMPPADLAKAPTPPQGFQVLSAEERRKLRHLTPDQLTGIPGLSQEITASTTWSTDFGQYAPSQSMLSQMLTGVGQLAAQATAAEAWSVYVVDELGLCTTSLLEQLDTVDKLLKGALQVNPALAQTYPQLVAFLAARSRVAQRGVATRKENKKKASKVAAASAATTPASAPAAATSNAAPAAAPASPATPAAGT